MEAKLIASIECGRSYLQQMHYESYYCLGLFTAEKDMTKKKGLWLLFLKYNELYEQAKEDEKGYTK